MTFDQPSPQDTAPKRRKRNKTFDQRLGDPTKDGRDGRPRVDVLMGDCEHGMGLRKPLVTGDRLLEALRREHGDRDLEADNVK